MKLEHIALNVQQPHEMANWYAEHMGMEIVKAVETAPYMHFIVDSDKTSMVELYNNPAGEQPHYAGMSPFTLHLAFAAADIAAERDRLVAAGASLEGDIETTPAGDQLLFLRDPWGVTIQLVKRASPMI